MRLSRFVLFLLLLAGTASAATESVQGATDLRAKYSAPQEQWPAPVLAPGNRIEPLAALPERVRDTDGAKSRSSALRKARQELGELLFFDPILSGSGQHACASCHDPDLGWADGRRFSFGHNRQLGQLNSPTILNAGYLKELFWDGRAVSLEEQAAASITNPIEMAGDPPKIIGRLQDIGAYDQLFERAFGDPRLDFDRVTIAIAEFVRQRTTTATRFDRFMRGERSALNDQELQGLHLFRTKGRCMNCHNGPLLTDGKYHHLGTAFYEVGNFTGRYAVTKKNQDFSAFRTAPLRNVAVTAPYMHNGLLADLDHVLASYNMGWWQNQPTELGRQDPRFAQLSSLIQPLNLDQQELQALKAFLLTLGNGAPYTTPTELPR
ncbi:MAG: cytochrome-c peroxidase [Marinobacter sp.]|uniref:cytochrome-c peroxidase n=1 Tax=Marinobacter sp. TaxID=50741 RepID=UPI003F9B81FA